jgi:hypothetical protein
MSRQSIMFEGGANPLTGAAADDDSGPSIKYTLRREATQHFGPIGAEDFEALAKSIKSKK